jgi:drug/metabolite transporter (DMT)-like permease
VEWFLLTLLSAFSLATSDALAKRHLTDCGTPELVLVRLVYPAILLVPLALQQRLPPLPMAFWGWLAVSLPLELVAMALYSRALRDSPMSLCLPYLAFSPVFTIFIAWAVLGEEVSSAGLAGIALVVAGTFLLHSRPGFDLRSTLRGPLRAFRRETGVRLMLMVAVIYSVTAVTSKAAMRSMPSEQFGAFYFVMLGAFTSLTMLVFRPRSLRVLARPAGSHWLIGGWFALMIVCHFLAIDRVQAAYMIATKRSSILFSVVYGVVLFGEPDFARRLLSATILVLGIAFIGLQGWLP